MIRLLVIAIAALCTGAGCSSLKEGSAVASPEPPQDVWQLAERAVSLVPLNVAKMESLLGTPMVQDTQNPRRFQGDAVRLGPSLQVSSSVIGIIDGAWSFAAIDIEPMPCVTLDMVQSRYPSVVMKSAPTGHSVYEKFVWAAPYDWGELAFGIREKDNCLTTVSLEALR